jgi:hypothetical protein
MAAGNALATRADMPFRGLQLFGTAFLNKLEGVQCPAPFLENWCVPGVACCAWPLAICHSPMQFWMAAPLSTHPASCLARSSASAGHMTSQRYGAAASSHCFLRPWIGLRTPGDAVLGKGNDSSRIIMQVIEWWAERSDLILLLFDAHKLDISDEFRSVRGSLRGVAWHPIRLHNARDVDKYDLFRRSFKHLKGTTTRCVSS